MALFSNFDAGAGLRKHADAFSRLNGTQQQKRYAKMVKEYEAYANKFLYNVLTNSATINPTELRHGAEALVDTAKLIDNTGAAYRTFSELAARSRKVPVVPQMGQLVDRLLALSTDQNRERANLLTWRIVTGTLGSERYLSYLRERAHLTDDSSDWRDYALGVARLIRDGVVQEDEEQIAEILEDLVKNKLALGDQAIPVQLMLAESMLARRSYRQAEYILTEVATSSKEDIPESLYGALETLLNSRPECCWELHQLSLDHAISQFAQGEMDWAALLQRLARAKMRADELLLYLLEHEQMPRNDRLSGYTLQSINNLAPDLAGEMRARWEQAFHTAGLTPPLAAQLHSELPGAVHVPEPPALANPGANQGARALANLAADEISDGEQLRGLLREHIPLADLDTASARAIIKQLANSPLPDWAPLEARMWLIEQFLRDGKDRSAINLLEELMIAPGAKDTAQLRERFGGDELKRFVTRIASRRSEKPISGEMRMLLVRLALSRNELQVAHELLMEFGEHEPMRQQAYREIERWVVGNAHPTAEMLMIMAKGLRLVDEKEYAGFETATTAALMAPENEVLQADYRAWLENMPELIVHQRRASQAMYICGREGRYELFPLVLGEIDALAALSEAPMAEPLEWMDQLLNVLLQLPPTARAQHRPGWLNQYLRLISRVDEPDRAAEQIMRALASLEMEEQLALLAGMRKSVPDAGKLIEELSGRIKADHDIARRREVKAELDTAKASGRPLRYSAGGESPDSSGTAEAKHAWESTQPWRRSLAIARAKLEAGDSRGAISDLQSVLEHGEDAPELHIELAEYFAKAGNFGLARQLFVDTLKILEDTHGDVELRLRGLYGLATVIEHLESPAEAVHHLEQLLIIRHDYRDSCERLKQLKQRLSQTDGIPPEPSNVAANVILDEIMLLLENKESSPSPEVDK